MLLNTHLFLTSTNSILTLRIKQCLWRSGRERLADEVPGRRARRAGRGPRGIGDDGARGRVPGRSGHRHLDRAGRAGDVAAGRSLRAVDVGRRARRAAGGLGASTRARPE